MLSKTPAMSLFRSASIPSCSPRRTYRLICLPDIIIMQIIGTISITEFEAENNIPWMRRTRQETGSHMEQDKRASFSRRGKEQTSRLWDRFLRTISRWPGQLRLMLLSIAVGLVAGLGAIFFDRLLAFVLSVLIFPHTGYQEPGTAAPEDLVAKMASVHSCWFLLIPALGGLLSGLLVYTIAPEAEGHGTDAMIESFHLRGGGIRKRGPFVKILASALTIGSGGSAGKEGPIAQIGSGVGAVF